MFTVKIEENQIFQNGQHVGSLSGTRNELWLKLGNETIARFKHHKPKANAVDFVKYVLARAIVGEVISGCKASTPIEWAMNMWGYESLNMRKAKAYKETEEYKINRALAMK